MQKKQRQIESSEHLNDLGSTSQGCADHSEAEIDDDTPPSPTIPSGDVQPMNEMNGSTATTDDRAPSPVGPDAIPDDVPGQFNDRDPDSIVPTVVALKTAMSFIAELRAATLDRDPLPDDARERLRSPATFLVDLSDKDLRLCIDMFLASTNGSEATYAMIMDGIGLHSPEITLLSHAQIKQRIQDLTGIFPIMTDMCMESCVAFTGPFREMTTCPICGEARYELAGGGNSQKSRPRKQSLTIPIGPQIQAQWRSEHGAQNMGYRRRAMEDLIGGLLGSSELSVDEYNDVYCGRAFLEAIRDGDIKPDDTVLMLSVDGAQLYQNKQSDCWIYIWVLLDLPPELRYKRRYVLPGGFIPGPNKPKNLDSFLFPGLHHLAALQRDGLRVWDAKSDRVFTSFPYFYLGMADGPGLSQLNGQVGHHGAFGCRLYCGLKGRHKENGPHYYPVMLKPLDYAVSGCDHDDIDIYKLTEPSPDLYQAGLSRLLQSRNDTHYKIERRETGICKPSLFSGLDPRRSLAPPRCFAIDIMHLISLNVPDLLLGLWRGTIDCDKDDSKLHWPWMCLTGDVWRKHGHEVALCRQYLPGSFDRPPRNPAEKISSGYKAWEFLMYLFGLGPGLLLDVLPRVYWEHFCKLVQGVRILHQRRIKVAQLIVAHRLLLEFVEEFELLYYSRLATRLHFVRQSVHAMVHLAPEMTRIGPGVYVQQWTLERTIGSLGGEVKQHSTPFANIANRGLRSSQVNALKAMNPAFDKSSVKLPDGAFKFEGYVLLGTKDKNPTLFTGAEADALRDFMISESGSLARHWEPRYRRWARLLLPNQQIARASWKEGELETETVRCSRNVKVISPSSNIVHISSEDTYRSYLAKFTALEKYNFIFAANTRGPSVHMH
jgi:hypothetical protein